MCIHVLPASVFYVPCAYSICRDKKGTTDPLELKLQIVVSCYVGVGN